MPFFQFHNGGDKVRGSVARVVPPSGRCFPLDVIYQQLVITSLRTGEVGDHALRRCRPAKCLCLWRLNSVEVGQMDKALARLVENGLAPQMLSFYR
jgi:hypothetical protein